MSITRNTPWRHISAVPYAIWKKRITDAGGLSAYADYDVWLAAGDDSAIHGQCVGGPPRLAARLCLGILTRALLRR